MPVVEVWKHGVRLLAKNVHMHSVIDIECQDFMVKFQQKNVFHRAHLS